MSAPDALLPGAAGRPRQASDLLPPGFGNVSLSVVRATCNSAGPKKKARPFFFGRGVKVLG